MGSATAAELHQDVANAYDRSKGFSQLIVVPMSERFDVTRHQLIQLCDAVISGGLSPEDLQPIASCLLASDHFEWGGDTPEDDLLAKTLHDWSAPDMSYPLLDTTIKLFRERLLTGEDVLQKRVGT